MSLKTFKTLQWVQLLTYIGGGGCLAIFALGGPKGLLIGAAVAAAAKGLTLFLPGKPPIAIPKDTPIVGADGKLTGAVNLSSTSSISSSQIKDSQPSLANGA